MACRSSNRYQVSELGEAAFADAVDLPELLDRPERVRVLPNRAEVTPRIPCTSIEDLRGGSDSAVRMAAQDAVQAERPHALGRYVNDPHGLIDHR